MDLAFVILFWPTVKHLKTRLEWKVDFIRLDIVIFVRWNIFFLFSNVRIICIINYNFWTDVAHLLPSAFYWQLAITRHCPSYLVFMSSNTSLKIFKHLTVGKIMLQSIRKWNIKFDIPIINSHFNLFQIKVLILQKEI